MTTNVLILCTHNSARSVLAEGMLNHLAKQLGKDIRAYSAGSHPTGVAKQILLQPAPTGGAGEKNQPPPRQRFHRRSGRNVISLYTPRPFDSMASTMASATKVGDMPASNWGR